MRRAADRSERAVAEALARLATSETLATVDLRPDGGERPTAGSRPAAVMRDAAGHRYFFKSASARHVAAETFAYGVRVLGRRPAIATAGRTLELEGVGSVRGMLQPLVDHAGERLPLDPRAWTPLQREVLLREHPWEWLLANFDTHVDQYVLFGRDQIPLNVDWDHALEDLHIEALDRFTKRSAAIAPIRNALYDAYVAGDVDLDWAGLRGQVRRIARLDDRSLARLLLAWARDADAPPLEARAAAEAFLRRKRGLSRTFRLFVKALQAERWSRLHPAAAPPLHRRLQVGLRDAWQRLLIESLHDRAVAPALRAYRRVLALRDRLVTRRP